MEKQQQKIPAANQEKDWAWKKGGGKKVKLVKWLDRFFFYRFIVNLCIKYFNSSNQTYTVYTQNNLMVLKLKRKISLSHSICQSALQHHSFIWFSTLKVKLRNTFFFFWNLSVCLILYRDPIKPLYGVLSCEKLSYENIHSISPQTQNLQN